MGLETHDGSRCLVEEERNEINLKTQMQWTLT